MVYLYFIKKKDKNLSLWLFFLKFYLIIYIKNLLKGESDMSENNFDAKKTVLISLLTLSAVLSAATIMIYLRDQKEKKKIGGRLIKVNYKYSKDFDV